MIQKTKEWPRKVVTHQHVFVHIPGTIFPQHYAGEAVYTGGKDIPTHLPQ